MTDNEAEKLAGEEDGPTGAVTHDRRYQEAMNTMRSVMTASVSAATALAAGSFALIGFGVENDSGALIMLAAAPFVAMALLFEGWRGYNKTTAVEVGRLFSGENLASDLSRRPTLVMTGIASAMALTIFIWGFATPA